MIHEYSVIHLSNMYKLVILIVDTIVNILLHYSYSHKYKIVHMNMYEDIMNIFNQSNYAFTYTYMYTYIRSYIHN